jgi:hypothetical protein
MQKAASGFPGRPFVDRNSLTLTRSVQPECNSSGEKV